MRKIHFIGLIVFVLASCSTSQDVVQDGFFQKRKYFKKGWFVDKPVTRGMEELAQEEIEAQGTPGRETYLRVIPAEIEIQEELEEIQLPELTMALEGPIAERTVQQARVFSARTLSIAAPAMELMPVVSPAEDTPLILPKVGGTPVLPLMATGIAILLPTALLFVLLLLIQRLTRFNDHGSMAAMVALLMGVLGLAALAVL